MKRKVIIITMLILALIIIGGFFFWKTTTTPSYSLSKVKQALEQHDIEMFKKYVGLDEVISSLIDQNLQNVDQVNETTNEMEQLGKEIGSGLIKLFKPQVTEQYKEEITKFIETGTFEYEQNTAKDKSYSLSAILTYSNNLNGIEYIKEEGKIAYVGIGLKQERYDTVLVIDIKMRDKGNYWQIIELPNIGKINMTINTLENKRLEKLNKPINSEMYSALTISSANKYVYTTDTWGFENEVEIVFEIKNIGNRAIREYNTVIKFSSRNSTYTESLEIESSGEILQPDETDKWDWTKKINIFIKEEKLFYDAPANEVTIDFTVNYILFEDGSELKLFKKWQN
jgi:hypothetical protein